MEILRKTCQVNLVKAVWRSQCSARQKGTVPASEKSIAEEEGKRLLCLKKAQSEKSIAEGDMLEQLKNEQCAHQGKSFGEELQPQGRADGVLEFAQGHGNGIV